MNACKGGHGLIPYLLFVNPIMLNSLALRAAKTGLTILLIFSSQKRFSSKIFEGEMFIRILPTTLIQIFCENLLYFQVIFKSMKIADDTFLGKSSVNGLRVTLEKLSSWSLILLTFT